MSTTNEDIELAEMLFSSGCALINFGHWRRGRSILRHVADVFRVSDPLLLEARLVAIRGCDIGLGIRFILRHVIPRFGLDENIRAALVAFFGVLDRPEHALRHCEEMIISANRAARQFATVVAKQIRESLVITDRQAMAFANESFALDSARG